MKRLSIVILGLIAFLCCPVHAQTAQRAQAEYNSFIKLNNSGGNESALYNALYSCCDDYLSLLRSSAEGKPLYVKARTVIVDIYPYLSNGAAYFSQNGNSTKALKLARYCVDIPQMKDFNGFAFHKDENYPSIVYFASSACFNAGDYKSATKYLTEYIHTGEESNRSKAYFFLIKAYASLNDNVNAINTIDEAVKSYPTDFSLLSLAINTCIDAKNNALLKKYAEMAAKLRPGDVTLMNIQGKVYEETLDFENALDIYSKLKNMNPRSLEYNKHLAINYYNMAALNFNKSNMEQNGKEVKKLKKQANVYFNYAIPVIQDILTTEPNNVKFIQALAIAQNCLGKTDKFNDANNKLVALGANGVSSAAVPSIIKYDSDRAEENVASNATTEPSASSDTDEETASSADIPLYSQYAKKFVESRLKTWQAKDPYETVDEYKVRVTESSRKTKVAELLKEAEANYIKTYEGSASFADMQLKPYDAQNRVFLVESKYGELIVPVPREHNEAKVFESGWDGMQFKEPKFYIDNDKLTLSSLTFVTPTGKTYRYDSKKDLSYTQTNVDLQFDAIDYNSIAQNTSERRQQHVTKQSISMGSSDVDMNIPVSKKANQSTFAVIIGNENYQSVASVPFALNDATTFSAYCQKTLGLPQKNIRVYKDATYGKMLSAIKDITAIANAYHGAINVIFYYAGHGVPDDATKQAYLLPVDADGTQTEACYSVARLYKSLEDMNVQSVVVFMDACFSGSKRGDGMIASARGVALKAKQDVPTGKMVVFSAASSDQTAYPYEEKGHGLFTYYLLKKLQDSKGEATLGEIGKYVTDNVGQQSTVVNHREQTPTVMPSPAFTMEWKNIKLK
jgi:uncharacterized caspase-like protein/tetratricopeptide (TPR) repeat protein